MKSFKFTFTEEEANYLLNALSMRPFNECHVLISNINKQAAEQVEEPKEVKLEPKK